MSVTETASRNWQILSALQLITAQHRTAAKATHNCSAHLPASLTLQLGKKAQGNREAC